VWCAACGRNRHFLFILRDKEVATRCTRVSGIQRMIGPLELTDVDLVPTLMNDMTNEQQKIFLVGLKLT